MIGLIRISPSCTRFTFDEMWRSGQRIHPAYRRQAYEREDGVGEVRMATPSPADYFHGEKIVRLPTSALARQMSRAPAWQPALDEHVLDIPDFLRKPLSPAKDECDA